MRTLVLNAGYEPLAIVSFKRALVLVLNDKATVIEQVEGEPVRAQHVAYERPTVILLTRYVRVPGSRRVPVTRRGVLRRDGHRCAYCGKTAATIDHTELDLGAGLERGHACGQGRDVDEDVLALIGRHEAESLVGVVPLHCSRRHA